MSHAAHVEVDLPEGPARQHWLQLGAEFLEQVVEPDATRLVVTHRFEEAVNRYQPLTPWEYGDQGSTVYMADKADGARAGAKTVTLAGRPVGRGRLGRAVEPGRGHGAAGPGPRGAARPVPRA